MRHVKNRRRKFPQRLPFQERLRISRIFSQTAKELGHNNEKRVVEAYQDKSASDIPEWIHSVRIGTPEEDRIGIDVIFDTDVGAIFVQVKGCHLALHHFNLQHITAKVRTKIHIISVIIFPSHSPSKIRSILNPLLWEEFSRLSIERRMWSTE